MCYKMSPRELQVDASNAKLHFSWCCDGGRIFLAFSLACGPGSPPKRPVQNATPSRGPFKPKPGSTSSSSQPGKKADKSAPKQPPKPHLGSLWSKTSKLSKGTGYGGPDPHASAPSSASATNPNVAGVSREDERDLTNYITALSNVLPCQENEPATGFDYTPQDVLAEMIARSPLIFRVSELLRQTSVDEIAPRFAVYSAALDFLHTMSGHPDLRLLLYTKQVLYAPSEQLPSFVFTSHLNQPAAITTDTTQSLDALLQELASCAQFFTQKMAGHTAELKSTEEKNLLALTQRVVSLAKRQEESRESTLGPELAAQAEPPNAIPTSVISTVTTRSRSAKEAENVAHERVRQESESWHRQNCVQELPDEEILKSFFFANKAREIESTIPAKGRMKKLVAQVASLRTDLPEGIFVRHGASRLDVMKVLIVGPRDTPYEHGLFEFDLFCNSQFPKAPPEMQFRTTGAGKVGFNPNLYANGKGKSLPHQ